MSIVNSNYSNAKREADLVDQRIIETLQNGRSFRVEAGAGSGKTYSLNKVIEWVQTNKEMEYSKKRQNVICITYTNAAVDVIRERISNDSFVLPSTIHSFAWNAIKQYQSTLIGYIEENEDMQPEEGDFSQVKEVRYTLGHRYRENGIQYLFHDDVLKLFCMLLDNSKFRKVFSDNYPLILIDEYQDSYKPVIDRFIEYFISQAIGPQFGFFGDSWQTIYQSNNACGLIEHNNIMVITKGSNFRSAPRIVQLLNDIRPDLPQQSAIDDLEGEVIVITCEDYLGQRRSDRGFKNDLPVDELKSRLNSVIGKLRDRIPADETVKALMITHKILAVQQGYDALLEIIKDGLRDKEDPFLMFFMETIEPIYKALQNADIQLLFNSLRRRYPITKKADKNKWENLKCNLSITRKERAIDVMKIIVESDLIPIPPKIASYYNAYYNVPDLMYANNVTIQDFMNIEYSQFLAAIDFLYPEAEFSTEHGVKGEEYDNVVFVISKGWNQYQFEIYTPMINGSVPIPAGKEAAYIRNRNLFYVCCSRAKKRLILFVSLKMNDVFQDYLEKLVGKNNIFTYSTYISK